MLHVCPYAQEMLLFHPLYGPRLPPGHRFEPCCEIFNQAGCSVGIPDLAPEEVGARARESAVAEAGNGLRVRLKESQAL